MELQTVGIDLGKTSFHVVGLDLQGKVALRKRFSRSRLLQFTANLRVHLLAWKLAVEHTFSAELSGSRATR